ncbi:insulinase family protein [Shewanella marina]|uniref:insulinase family protein n=1 Tax=Shewanella marina TaxID=487319 RepID=UPI0004726C06|nr:insulinase family protein [Shewanella marina]
MSDSILIKKSPNDSRQYQYLTLDNQLQVLLVEDMNAEQAAASIAVNVGHFDDPIERPGMAHFLEHMLFLGTEKYPAAEEYHQFINQFGGNHNAWTGTEHTNFFYSINPDVLEPSLDRFSQFFIAPSFDIDLVDRERHAIESEFSLKLKDDVRRSYQVLKESVNQQHPFSKFSVGNLTTLAGEQQQLKDEVLNFYQQHYSANLMRLCIVAPVALDKLAQLAQQYFGAIVNRQITKQYPNVPLLAAPQLTQQINIIPLKTQQRLTISFNLPNIDQFYQNKPLTYLSHILGNESNGSLLANLKELQLADQLSAGGGVSGYNFKNYSISIHLTDEGWQQVDLVIQLTFEFLALIKQQGIEAWRYDERANLLKLAFKYQEKINPQDLASHLSINMHHYPMSDVLYGDYRMDGLLHEQTQALLDLMNVDNMRLELVGKKQELAHPQQAAWYDTPYSISAIEPERLAQWRNLTPRAELQLSAPNPFIISDAEVFEESSDSAIPQIATEGAGYRIWHKKDDTFNVPKGHIYLSIDSIQASQTPKHAALTRLYVEILLDYLVEYTYQAEVAGLGYNIYPHQGGITLHLSGFTGKQEQLLELIISKARLRDFSQERFDLIKKQLLESWHNQKQAKPISQLFTSLTVTLQKSNYEPEKLAALLAESTLADLYQHIDEFYQAIHVEGLLYGNYPRKEAARFGKNLQQLLSIVSQPSDEAKRELINLAGYGSLLRDIQVEHQDSAIIVYYQAQQANSKQMALYALLNHTMSSTFYHELRTEKQLGYMVGTGYLPLNRHPGMIFYIQSPTASPLQLLKAIDEFIADFTYALLQITDQQWLTTKQGLVQQLLERDTNLKASSQRFWGSIGNKDYQFNQRELVASHIESLERADLIKLTMQKMRPSQPDRLILTSTGVEHRNEPSIPSSKYIDDITQFKADAAKFLL